MNSWCPGGKSCVSPSTQPRSAPCLVRITKCLWYVCSRDPKLMQRALHCLCIKSSPKAASHMSGWDMRGRDKTSISDKMRTREILHFVVPLWWIEWQHRQLFKIYQKSLDLKVSLYLWDRWHSFVWYTPEVAQILLYVVAMTGTGKSGMHKNIRLKKASELRGNQATGLLFLKIKKLWTLWTPADVNKVNVVC